MIDDVGPNDAPLPDLVLDHRSVGHACGLYMGFHNPPGAVGAAADTANKVVNEVGAVVVGDLRGQNDPPPEFPLPPDVAGQDSLPDDDYFLPLNADNIEDIPNTLDDESFLEAQGDPGPNHLVDAL